MLLPKLKVQCQLEVAMKGELVMHRIFFLLSNQANLALEIMLSFDVGSMVLYIEIDLRVDQVFDCKFDFTTHIGLYVMRN